MDIAKEPGGFAPNISCANIPVGNKLMNFVQLHSSSEAGVSSSSAAPLADAQYQAAYGQQYRAGLGFNALSAGLGKMLDTRGLLGLGDMGWPAKSCVWACHVQTC